MNAIEDCIAMSEDADWFAFAPDWTRGQVIGALAYDSSWWDVLHGYTIRKGYVWADTEGPPYAGFGTTTWYECEADHPNAERVWIVRRASA